MNEQAPATPRSTAAADMRLVWLALAVFAAAKLAFALFAGPLPDEAYYWLWGQHTDWSYFDHPPLQAWMQAVASTLLGHSTFALRAPALLTTALTLCLLAWWTRRAVRAGAEARLPVVAAVWFASPVMFVYSTLVFNDHLMIALLGLAAAAFTVAFERMVRDGRAHAAALWLAGLALGLATLAKYNAALFGIAAGLAIVLVPRLRPLLRSPHLYGAAILSAACLLPVLLWNMEHANESFRYNLVDRLSAGWSPAQTAQHVVIFAVLAPLTFSAFLIPAVVGLARGRAPAFMKQGWRALALSALAVAMSTCLAVAFLGPVQFYWSIPGYVAFLALAALLAGRAMLRAHLVTGIVVALAFTANYALLPLAALFGGADQESAMVYGWDEVAARVERERDAAGAGFLVATDYRSGAILAFETGDRMVDVISTRRSQFDLWFDEAARAGRDALILSDDWHPLDATVAERFASVEQVAEIPVVRFGRHLKTYVLHVGRGYLPREAQGGVIRRLALP